MVERGDSRKEEKQARGGERYPMTRSKQQDWCFGRRPNPGPPLHTVVFERTRIEPRHVESVGGDSAVARAPWSLTLMSCPQRNCVLIDHSSSNQASSRGDALVKIRGNFGANSLKRTLVRFKFCYVQFPFTVRNSIQNAAT